MEEQILNQMKESYKAKKEEQDNLKKVTKRLLELEEIAEVKEYIKLKDAIKDYNNKLLSCTNDELIFSAYYRHIHKIKETNGIYVCVGTFKTNHTVDIEHGSNDYRLLRSDSKAEYRLYQNIENSNDLKRIPIRKCNEFEQNNQVIIAPYLNGDYYYHNIQSEFFKDCILENQEVAVAKILKKKK